MINFTESIIEEAALAWLGPLGYTRVFGPDLAADGSKPERTTYQEVILTGRLLDALRRS